MTRPEAIRLLSLITLTSAGFLGAFVLFQNDRDVEVRQWLDVIDRAEPDEILVTLETIAEDEEVGVDILVKALSNDRELVVAGAQKVLVAEFNSWRQMHHAKGARKIAYLVELLSENIGQFPKSSQQMAADLAAEIVLWPTHEDSVDHIVLLNHCENILRISPIQRNPTELVDGIDTIVAREGSNNEALEDLGIRIATRPEPPFPDVWEGLRRPEEVISDEPSLINPGVLLENEVPPYYPPQPKVPTPTPTPTPAPTPEPTNSDPLLQVPSSNGDPQSRRFEGASPQQISLVQHAPTQAGGTGDIIQPIIPKPDFFRDDSVMQPNAPRDRPLKDLADLDVIRRLHEDEIGRRVAEHELRKRGFRDVVIELAYKMGNPNPLVRAEVPYQLMVQPSSSSNAWLKILAQDRAPNVRIAALSVLATSSNAETLKFVDQKLRSETNADVIKHFTPR